MRPQTEEKIEAIVHFLIYPVAASACLAVAVPVCIQAYQVAGRWGVLLCLYAFSLLVAAGFIIEQLYRIANILEKNSEHPSAEK